MYTKNIRIPEISQTKIDEQRPILSPYENKFHLESNKKKPYRYLRGENFGMLQTNWTKYNTALITRNEIQTYKIRFFKGIVWFAAGG